MFELSALRWGGLVLGLAILVVVFFRLRRHPETRGDVFITGIVGVAVCMVSLFPEIVDFPAEIISPGYRPGARVTALLILFSLMLWGLLMQTRQRSRRQSITLDRLCRSISLDRFAQKYGEAFPKNAIVVAIPAYNEAENLQQLLPLIPAEVSGTRVVVVVIDDGSSDDTCKVAEQLGAFVARHPVNRGSGSGVRTGMQIAADYEAKVLVNMDADCQHDPDDMAGLVQPILDGEHAIVVGSRLLGGEERVSVLRSVGLRFFNVLIGFLVGAKITDCSSGYRAANVTELGKLNLVQDQYYTTEILIEAHKRMVNVGERPMTVHLRHSGESKKGHDLLYGARFFGVILSTWLR